MAEANLQMRSMGVIVGVPLPDVRWGALTFFSGPAPEVLAVELARFVATADEIEAAIRSRLESYPAIGDIRIHVLPDASFSISWITQAPEGFVSFTLQRGRGMILDWSPPNRGSQTRPPPFGSGSAHSDFGGGQSQVQSDFIVHPAGQRPLQTGWASSDAVTTPRPIPPRTANETTPAKTNFLTSTSFLARLPWGIRERQPQEGPAEGFGATSATLRPHHLPVEKVQPRYAVISSARIGEGTNRTYCHPRSATVETLTAAMGGPGTRTVQSFDGAVSCRNGTAANWVEAAASDRLWATARDGTVTLVTTGDGTFTRDEEGGVPVAAVQPSPGGPAPAAAPGTPVTAQDCCRVCNSGKPCGDSCIAATSSCSKPPGCACAAHQRE